MAVCALGLFACGNKADPVAPRKPGPENVRDLEAALHCETIELKFQPPTTRTDGSELEPPLRFEIFRRFFRPVESPEPTPDAEGKVRFAKRRFTVPRGNFESHGEIAWEDLSKQVVVRDSSKEAPFEPGVVYLYQVVTEDSRGHTSTPSNTSQIQYGTIPKTPEGLVAAPVEGGIQLRWQAVDSTCVGEPLDASEVGYLVYRKAEDAEEFGYPLNSEVLAVAEYRDESSLQEKTYEYAVRAVALERQAEGLYSESLKYTVADREAPAPPGGLLGTRTRRSVQLLWNSSPSRDVVGYWIYRQSRSGVWERLNAEPLRDTSYQDEAVEARQGYRYRVTSVDGALEPNESLPSEEVQVNAYDR